MCSMRGSYHSCKVAIILCLMTPRRKGEEIASSASALGRWVNLSHSPDNNTEARDTGDCVTRMRHCQKQSPATSVSDYLSKTLGSWLRDQTPLTAWLMSTGRACG